MSDEPMCNRDWGFADSKKDLGFNFRMYCHVFRFVTFAGS